MSGFAVQLVDVPGTRLDLAEPLARELRRAAQQAARLVVRACQQRVVVGPDFGQISVDELTFELRQWFFERAFG
jgi:hypothetical protein